MAEQHSIKIPAHHNIYLSPIADRELRIDFSTPQNGVNSHTGILVLVPGFGASIDSNVYKKMRDVFSDKYNMVTVQCEYFGSVFMQGAHNIAIKDKNALESTFSKEEADMLLKDPSTLLNILKEKEVVLLVEERLNEKPEEFNDMSYMQAIDIITSIEIVKAILDDNQLIYDTGRIIGYGHSHGAYLLHLCNILAPGLFSYIIDNSAWTEPKYMINNRYLYSTIGKGTLCIEFDYLAKKVVPNQKDLRLESLYSNYNGDARIISFQGDNDNLVNYKEKQSIIEKINNSKFVLVTEKDVDNKKYKSNTHGLNADFFELFFYAMEYESHKKVNSEMNWKYEINLMETHITVSDSFGLPLFSFEF